MWQGCPYDAFQFEQNFENIKVVTPRKVRVAQRWHPPTGYVLKFNVDGSSRGSPGVAGVGGVVRNAHWKVLGYFSKNVGEKFAYEAEVLAILHTLLFCQQYALFNVLIESDCLLVVGWVHNKSSRPWMMQNEFNLMDFLLQVGVVRLLREGNWFANFLAKGGCDRVEPIWCLCDPVVLAQS